MIIYKNYIEPIGKIKCAHIYSDNRIFSFLNKSQTPNQPLDIWTGNTWQKQIKKAIATVFPARKLQMVLL